MKMKTQRIEHELSETWRKHVQETLAQIQAISNTSLQLRGQIQIAEQTIEQLKTHLSVLCAQIPLADKAKKSVVPWRLSEDGTKLIGEVEST